MNGIIFFFMQKTAYEMRISDWSSDVCSSDRTSFGFVGGIVAVHQQKMGIDPQSLCNSLDVVDRDVALAPLDSAEICSIHLNIEGKILLTQAARFPVAADIRSYDLA